MVEQPRALSAQGIIRVRPYILETSAMAGRVSLSAVCAMFIASTACTDDRRPAVEAPHVTHSGIHAPDRGAPAQPPILTEIDRVNDTCRGADEKIAASACEKRDALIADAEKQGWCWGPREAIGADQHWIQCSDDPARAPKRQWFALDINHTHCMQSASPADRVRELSSFGRQASPRDLPSGGVEVESEMGNGKSEVWTYYRTEEACTASLPGHQKIDSKYE